MNTPPEVTARVLYETIDADFIEDPQHYMWERLSKYTKQVWRGYANVVNAWSAARAAPPQVPVRKEALELASVLRGMVGRGPAPDDLWERDQPDGDPFIARAAELLEALAAEPKDHEIAQAVNALRDIAIEFHATQQLRERIAGVVLPLVRRHAVASAEPKHMEPSEPDEPCVHLTIVQQALRHAWTGNTTACASYVELLATKLPKWQAGLLLEWLAVMKGEKEAVYVTLQGPPASDTGSSTSD